MQFMGIVKCVCVCVSVLLEAHAERFVLGFQMRAFQRLNKKI